MPPTTVFRTLSPSKERIEADIPNLIERARMATGHQPLDEHRWSLVGRDPDQRLLVAADGDGDAFGIALISPAGETWNVDLVIDPLRRSESDAIAELVNRATSQVRSAGGGYTQMWVHNSTDIEAEAAVGAGLDERRDLHQLRVPLPLEATADEVSTRPFVVGQDEAAWLEVNAAAFAGHADQGQWTLDDLMARQAEPWFDTEGFLLHEIDDSGRIRLAGFNWTKVHGNPSGSTETLGEIYVIGVHPDFAGRGLGRRLCVAGLDHLAAHAKTGMLYVDADNEPAMRLYLGLGFTIDHTNTAFAGSVA